MSNENENDKMDREWDFDVNLSGLNAPAGKGDIALPMGYYTVGLTDLFINKEKNPNRVIIKVTVDDGTFKGIVRVTGIGKPNSAEDKVRYYWRGLAESAGYTPAQLDAGQVKLGLVAFKGRKAHIKYTPAPKEGEYDKVDFLAPGEWKSQKAMFEATPKAAVEATPSNGVSTSGGTKSKGDVLQKLGVQLQ